METSITYQILLYLILGKDIRDTPIIVASTDSEESLTTMAKQSKLIINAVGPVSYIPYKRFSFSGSCQRNSLCDF